ncbi:MAG: N-acetylmuramoyl-L-alanine amidase [Bacteroidales bacterium]|jgi:N-acetylmuramoyl-L-alanine amidase|nr:N-acetylmuramoyl-L-alanine amidase [Bacteroidales bacterium]
MERIKHVILIFLLFSCSCAYSQSKDTVKTVVAGKGDGIYKILRENGYSAKDYYNIFLELNRDKIKDDDSLIHGEVYILPKLSGTGQEEIDVLTDSIVSDSVYSFCDSVVIKTGLQFTDTIVDNKLEGALIYLVSGHGGPDPGAVAVVDGHTISEDEYAYDICLRIAKNIEEHSGKVYMIINDPNDSIRDDRYLKLDYDEYCYPDLEIPRNQTERLKQRADAINILYKENKDIKYQRVLDIHLDSRSNGTRLDVFFYHCEKSVLGQKFAEAIQKIFSEKYAKHQPNRGYIGTVTARDLYVIRKVSPPAILIELGNIQNERDRKRFLDHNNRQALANWITEGIIEDFNNNR